MKKFILSIFLSLLLVSQVHAAVLTKAFTSTGSGTSLSVKTGDSFTYSITGTFVGSVTLQKSTSGGASWEPVVTKTAPATDTIVVESRDANQVSYRFQCSAYTSGTINTSLTDETMAPIEEFKNRNGETVAFTTENGLTVKDLTVTGTGGGTDGTGGTGGNAEDVVYDNVTFPNVESALNFLIIGGPQILTFTNNKNSLENGTVVTSTVLSWTIAGTITGETLDNSIGAVTPINLRTKTHTSTYSTNRTYQLSITDGSLTDTATTSITFKNSNYKGVNSGTTLTDNQINAMTPTLSTSRSMDFTANPVGERVHIYYPAAYGAPTITVNGFTYTDYSTETVPHTNASGATVSYLHIYTNNLLDAPVGQVYTFVVR